VSGSLWECSADELLRRAASAEPTPGGGSIAAVTAAFGFSLVLMAIGVTLAGEEGAADDRARLIDGQSRARALQQEAVAAVDLDVTEFDAVMAGYRLPRDTDAQRAFRRQRIDDATAAATGGPLRLAEAAIEGIELVDEIEPLIKPSIVSDAEAGRDLLRGAAFAALRTADINLLPLEERQHAAAPALRRRRDAAGSLLMGRQGTA